jgi:hypothetical protein
MGKKQTIEQLIAVPTNVVKAGIAYGLGTLAQSKEVFLPSLSWRQFAKNLEEEKPLSDAGVAMKAIESGRQLNLPELEFIGEAVLTKTLIRAETNPATPRHITAQVAETVEEVGIDPELVPLLNDDDAQQAKGILQSYRKVKHLFPNK